jgi:hypothetical protein
MRAEKRVMDAAMKTRKGRAMLKEHIPADTPARRVLDAVVAFAAAESGPAQAELLENTVLKLLIKFLVLHKHDLLDPREMAGGLGAVVGMCREIATATAGGVRGLGSWGWYRWIALVVAVLVVVF